MVADTSWQTVPRAGRNGNRPLDTGAETTHFNRGQALQLAPTGSHVPAGAYLSLPYYWFLRVEYRGADDAPSHSAVLSQRRCA